MTQLGSVLQSCSNQNNLLLTSGKTHIKMENRKPREETTHL